MSFGMFRNTTWAAAVDYPPSSSYAACAEGQLEYWAWDHYTRLWAHRCVNANDTVLASEGDLVAFPRTANLETQSPATLALIDQTVDVSGLTTPTSSTPPQASEVIWGRLKKSSACPLVDANLADIPTDPTAGCDHDTATPSDADAKAVDTGGSVGIHAVSAHTPSASTISFTWDISRWAKGDVFVGTGDAFIKVFDRDFKFKRYIALSDHERIAVADAANQTFQIPGPNSLDPYGPSSRVIRSPDAQYYTPEVVGSTTYRIGRVPAGCAVNFRTGEPFLANFDYYDPGLNFVGRQPGDTSSAAGHGDLPYSDLSRRISTARFRANDVNSRAVIDYNPESVKFDRDMNLYVGHEQPWTTGDGSVVDVSSPDDDGATAPAGHLFSDFWLTLYDGTNPLVTQEGQSLYTWDTRVKRDATDPSKAYWEDVRYPYLHPDDPNPFAWLLNALGQRIPFPRVLGRSLHRYASPSRLGNDWSASSAQYYLPFTARTGVDWIDLTAPSPADVDPATGNLVRKPTVLYTSQSGDIYRFDVETGEQLGEWNTQRLFPSELHTVRLLPPGDGTDLLVVALDLDNPAGTFANNTLMRVQLDSNGQARIVQTYRVPDVVDPAWGFTSQPLWRTIDISPDGRTFVAAASHSANVYRFDVATGAYLIQHVTNNTSVDYLGQSVCVIWQYNTQQEICGNGKDDDGDGINDNSCASIPTAPDALIARDDSFVTRENVTLTVGGTGVLTNDGSEFSAGSLSVSSVTVQPVNGTLTVNNDGSFTYAPAPNFHGQDTFKYKAAYGSIVSNETTVTITVSPLVRDDGPFSVWHTQTLTISGVLVNDSNHSTPMTVTAASGSSSFSAGSTVSGAGLSVATALGANVVIYPDGHFVYTPLLGFDNVEDHFYYRAADAFSDGTNADTLTYGSSARFARVTILVLDGGQTEGPRAFDNYYSTLETEPLPGGPTRDNGGRNIIANPETAALPDNRDQDPDFDPIWVNGFWASDGASDVDYSDRVATDAWAEGTIDTCLVGGGQLKVWRNGDFDYQPQGSGCPFAYGPVRVSFQYTITDGARTSNRATAYIDVQPSPTFPTPIAYPNAYETTTGFNLDVHYPPCIANPGQIEGLNLFPPSLRPDCPPSEDNNPNAVNGILKLGDDMVGYVDADNVDARGVQVLQLKPAVPAPSEVHTDWADDLTALRVHSWGLKAGEMPAVIDPELWISPADGDDMYVCGGLAQGTTDAYCPTRLGGLLEIWPDGTFRYQPPNLATPQPDWFWYRVQDGHGQVSNWAQVTINVQAKMQIHANPQTRPYGAPGPDTAGAGYFDFLLNTAYTADPQQISRPADMSGALSCTAWEDQASGTPVDQFTPTGVYPITCTGETRPGYKITYVASTLTITAVPLTITADDKTKVYDGQPYSPFTVQYSGFVNGEGPDVLTGTLAYSGAGTTAVDVNPGPGYSIVPGGLTSANYAISFVEGTLTITPAALTITADDKEKFYDGLPFAGGFTSQYSGFVNGEGPGVLTGTLLYAGAAPTAVDANTTPGYPIVPGGQSSTDYSITYVPGTLVIKPLATSVSVPPVTVSYDGQPHPTTCAVNSPDEAALTGTLSYSPTGLTAAGAYTATCTFAGDQNHLPASGQSTITINPVPLTIAAEDKEKVYDGQPFLMTLFTVTYSGFVNGEDASVLGGLLSFSGQAVTAVNANTYSQQIVPGGLTSTNYVPITYVPGTLTITPVTPTVTVPSIAVPYDGQPHPTTCSVTSPDGAALTGTLSYSPAGLTAVGSYTATCTFAGDANHGPATGTGTIAINSVPLTITADDQTKVYDGQPFTAFTVQYAGFVNGEGPGVLGGALVYAGSSQGAIAVNAAPGYTIVPSGLTSTNYAPITFVQGALTITRRPLTVIANDKSRPYAQPNPTLDGSLTGVATGDDITATYSTTAVTQSSPVGTYANDITATLVDPDGKLGNYTVTNTPGTFTITPLVLTVTVDDASKAYGAPLPTFSATIAGFVNGDDVDTAVDGSPALTPTATQGSSVGSYPINVAVGTLAATNYTFQFVSGALAITPVPLTITAENKTKVYDKQPFTAFTVQYGGFVNGDGPDALTGTLGFAGSGVGALNVGAYAIVPGGLTSGNYSPIAFVPGTLTITPAPLTITANNQAKLIGTTFVFTGSEFTVGAGQLKPGDTIVSVLLASAGAPASAAAGVYDIYPSAAQGTGLGNYVITYVNGFLTIFTNRPPIAEDDSGSTTGTTPVSVSVLPNDHDPDEGDTISIVSNSFTTPITLINGVPVPTGSLSVNYVTGVVTYTAPYLFAGVVTFTYTIRDQIGTSDVDPTHPQNSVGTVTITVLPAEVCYVGTKSPQITARQQFWADVDGNITVRTWLARNFVDNTYGNGQIGWSGSNHTYNMLIGSDMVQVALYDKLGVKKMEFKQDYASAATDAPSGYRSLGVIGGDGAMLLGSAADVVGANSSLAVNLNNGGIVGAPFDTAYVLTVDSPATDAKYTPNPGYPNWIFDVWYEATIDASAIGASGFGYPRITSMHASPSKTSNDTEPLAVISCVAPLDAPAGVPDYYEVGAGNTLTVGESGVLANDVDPQSQPMTAVLEGQVSKGTLSFKTNGTFAYLPPVSYGGVVTFGYRPKDSDGNVGDLVIVSITVESADLDLSNAKKKKK